MPNVPEYVAILYGPIVLAARTGTEDLVGLIADDGRWSQIPSGRLLPLDKAPMLVGDLSTIPDQVRRIDDGQGLRFKAEGVIRPQSYKDLVLEPFFRVHDARYMIYWRLADPNGYARIQQELRAKEAQQLLLDQQTIDRVIPGEQQPEADHNMQHQGSESGIHQGMYFRHARAPGWFSYELKVIPDETLDLYVLYWANETGSRTFDIKVDGTPLATENLVGKWGRDGFEAVRYPLPKDLIKGKETITVRFEPHPGNYAGGIFYLRIIRSQQSGQQ
jgi:hypothetical protein